MGDCSSPVLFCVDLSRPTGDLTSASRPPRRRGRPAANTSKTRPACRPPSCRTQTAKPISSRTSALFSLFFAPPSGFMRADDPEKSSCADPGPIFLCCVFRRRLFIKKPSFLFRSFKQKQAVRKNEIKGFSQFGKPGWFFPFFSIFFGQAHTALPVPDMGKTESRQTRLKSKFYTVSTEFSTGFCHLVFHRSSQKPPFRKRKFLRFSRPAFHQAAPMPRKTNRVSHRAKKTFLPDPVGGASPDFPSKGDVFR